ncbi:MULTISPECIES: phosphoesterase [Micromonosporaceae]|uniref:phosphoesterase n=1 Tax=Micromonosporaceae TaxID=28056 RepID=UPI00248D033A|nr:MULTISPECIES: phosphoesterase [unclassified Solwaraspora]WBB96103.1 phosphoesterase [Solwaraspora sp. WMMA2059]WBC19992.1 phosphoesterase [Solwaraspora sp. WMMA2080]WJK32411.1 phosphoesterase [Solwaraspora sp. WMMA2065]
MDQNVVGQQAPTVEHNNNGEENTYPNYVACFHKGLPHDDDGEVDPNAYRQLLRALASRSPESFERVPMGTVDGVRLTNPLAGLARHASGTPSDRFRLRPAPRLDGAEHSAEMVELYWMALCRDVPFAEFGSDPTVAEAAAELGALSDYRAPRSDGSVTAATVFRGDTPGDLAGPYLSQFLLRDLQFGTFRTQQRQDTVRPGQDYMTTWNTWLKIQRGFSRGLGPQDRDRNRTRYLATPRDLAHYVHFDATQSPFQPYLHAALILQDLDMPLDANLPYQWSINQLGFGTFGWPHLYDLVTGSTARALRTVWFQKWWVHRRLRPEASAGLVHKHLSGRRRYDFLHHEVLESEAARRSFARNGSYLLPQAYPEGSPTHPSYGAGHAAVAGAGATLLKAWFDETAVIPNPVEVSPDGTTLIPYLGSDAARMTVGGELDKLAANIAIGRNIAGVHYRSDYAASLELGEQVAIDMLRSQRGWFEENYSLTLTRFNGQSVTI